MKTGINILLASLVMVTGQVYAERPHDPGANARGLREQPRAIRQEERSHKADGQLTPQERKDLHQDLNNLSKDIYKEKHDADSRSRAR